MIMSPGNRPRNGRRPPTSRNAPSPAITSPLTRSIRPICSMVMGTSTLLRLERRRGGALGQAAGVEVAGDEVAVLSGGELRLDSLADVHYIRAARVEVAAARRVDRARHVAGQDDPLALFLHD